MDIEKTIRALRDSDPYIKTIFTQGGCYKFHLFLKAIYPKAIPVINAKKDHVGSLIHGDLYDINGRVNWDYMTMRPSDYEECKTWSFSRSQMLLLCECPNCDEPIVI